MLSLHRVSVILEILEVGLPFGFYMHHQVIY